jgi:hypothetical protein
MLKVLNRGNFDIQAKTNKKTLTSLIENTILS